MHGAIVVARGGRPLVRSADGSADAAGERAPSVDTRFRIASLTKLLTQVAVGRLVQRGELDLDAPLGSIVSDLPEWLATDVTSRHLVDMTSGLPRELAPDPADSGVDLDAAGSCLPFFAALEVEPEFAPGTGRAYSNVGYWLLGAVVEAKTEQPFERAVGELVLEPLGMRATGMRSPEDLSKHAVGLVREGDALAPAPAVDYARRFASGGFYSTVDDLLRLCRALRDDAFLGEEGRALVLGNDHTLLVAGMLPGFMNALVYDADRDVAVIALNNLVADDPNAFIGLVRELAGLAGEGAEAGR